MRNGLFDVILRVILGARAAKTPPPSDRSGPPGSTPGDPGSPRGSDRPPGSPQSPQDARSSPAPSGNTRNPQDAREGDKHPGAIPENPVRWPPIPINLHDPTKDPGHRRPGGGEHGRGGGGLPATIDPRDTGECVVGGCSNPATVAVDFCDEHDPTAFTFQATVPSVLKLTTTGGVNSIQIEVDAWGKIGRRRP